ncbi:hypothetical protein IAQ61_006208 [Plenodomus lingam]|uniref:uncharacterized protein n=1 Tax=Leptosphaeria maculans TaxID=5022 RepID=UPI003329FC09|nr:hypothetical protein IAQ61_006208 [Plenodomus lingam]
MSLSSFDVTSPLILGPALEQQGPVPATSPHLAGHDLRPGFSAQLRARPLAAQCRPRPVTTTTTTTTTTTSSDLDLDLDLDSNLPSSLSSPLPITTATTLNHVSRIVLGHSNHACWSSFRRPSPILPSVHNHTGRSNIIAHTPVVADAFNVKDFACSYTQTQPPVCALMSYGLLLKLRAMQQRAAREPGAGR